MSKINDLKEKRAGLVQQMRSLLDTAEKDGNRDLSADEQTNYSNLEKEFDGITAKLTREEKQSGIEAQLKAQRDGRYVASLEGEDEKTGRSSKEYARAFSGLGGYLRNKGHLPHELSNVLRTGVDVDGGYLVPEEFETRIVELLYNMDPIRAAATVIRTGSDRNIPVQTGGASFSWLAENAAYGTTNPTFGRVILGAHKLGGIIPISEELLNDAATDITAFIQMVGSQAIADEENEAFTIGDGSNKPLGLFSTNSVANVSIVEKTGAVSATAAITGDDLIDTFHTLGRQYRTRAIWLMSDTMAKLIRKLKGEDNQYLWQPGLTAGQPDTLLTRPVAISDFAPAPAVSTRSICFGDMTKYYIADRIGIAVQRLNELYAANGQVAFRMHKRTDARLVDAKAITFFKHGAAS
jgi:HK97 family phage major capsid protein